MNRKIERLKADLLSHMCASIIEEGEGKSLYKEEIVVLITNADPDEAGLALTQLIEEGKVKGDAFDDPDGVVKYRVDSDVFRKYLRTEGLV